MIGPPPELNCGEPIFNPQKLYLEFKKQERKIIRLIAKQYHVESLSQEEPIMSDCGRMVRQNPIVLTYWSKEHPRKRFEWPFYNVNFHTSNF